MAGRNEITFRNRREEKEITIIKQTGVQSSGHMKNLRGYINDDRKVILRDSLNMDGCTNPKRWAHHMWMTREAYGHNKAARRIRDKKTGELKEAKNTVLFHQILGFNPDECDLNGGRLSPEACMLLPRANTIPPVIHIRKASARPADHRRVQLLKCIHKVFSDSMIIRNLRILSNPDSIINTGAKKLDKVSLQFRVNIFFSS